MFLCFGFLFVWYIPIDKCGGAFYFVVFVQRKKKEKRKKRKKEKKNQKKKNAKNRVILLYLFSIKG